MEHLKTAAGDIRWANVLTFTRIALIVPFVALTYIDASWARWSQVALFLAACITDYFDGYVARSMNQTSRLGVFLDPIADKLLVSVTILCLCFRGNLPGIHLLPAIVILCREILVSGLREFLAELQVSIPVTRLAKWKTGVQMTALCWLMAPDEGLLLSKIYEMGLLMLWVAAILTLITGYDYLQAAKAYFEQE